MCIRNIIGVLLLAACAAEAWGQTVVHDTIYIVEPNPKQSVTARMLGFGRSNILDTYLSPEIYTGPEISYLSHTTYRKEGRHWSTQVVNRGSLTYADNRSGDGREMAGAYNFGYGRHYNWDLQRGDVNVKAGLMAEMTLGFIYNTRNSNNPAQARAAIHLSPNASVQYKLRLGRRRYLLRYELNVPLVGLMFSPNYGQSYYEIFTRGNYDHNLVVTTPVSAPSLRQLLTFDFTLRHTTLRIGYLGDYQQAKVNGLRQHAWSSLVVLGIVRKFSINKIIP